LHVTATGDPGSSHQGPERKPLKNLIKTLSLFTIAFFLYQHFPRAVAGERTCNGNRAIKKSVLEKRKRKKLLLVLAALGM
jgi:hypothetical protein